MLAPGAGTGSDHPTLLAIDAAVGERGVTTRRIDFRCTRVSVGESHLGCTPCGVPLPSLGSVLASPRTAGTGVPV